MERMENYRTAKRVRVGERAGRRSVGRPSKRWINTEKDSLKKIGLDVRQARRLEHDRSVWRFVCEGGCVERHSGDEPLTLTRCHR